MSRPKPVLPESAADVPADPAGNRGKAPARPKVLKGMSMPPYELPPDFDLTVHQRLYESGDVKPITRAEIAARIKVLKQKKQQLG
jgi:hypothetical protein